MLSIEKTFLLEGEPIKGQCGKGRKGSEKDFKTYQESFEYANVGNLSFFLNVPGCCGRKDEVDFIDKNRAPIQMHENPH